MTERRYQDDVNRNYHLGVWNVSEPSDRTRRLMNNKKSKNYESIQIDLQASANDTGSQI